MVFSQLVLLQVCRPIINGRMYYSLISVTLGKQRLFD